MQGVKTVGWATTSEEEDDSVCEATAPLLAAKSTASTADDRVGDVWASSALRTGRRKSSTAKLGIERLVRTREKLWPTAVAALVSSVPAFLVGFTLSFTSAALLELTATTEPEKYQLNRRHAELFGAFVPIGAVLGGPIAGWLADRLGRKPALLLSGIPYLAGYLMIAYARFCTTALAFRAVVLTGRLLTGLSVGWSCLAVPVYIGEMSSAKLRGVFGTFNQLFLAVGVAVPFGLASIPGFYYYNNALVAAGIVAMFELGMVWLPETPRWLFFQGRKDEGKRVLTWLRGPKVGISVELSDLEAASSAKRLTVLQVIREFTKWRLCFPLFLIIVVMFLQQSGGLSALGSYLTLVFQDAGVSHPELAALCSTLIPCIGVLISGFIVDLVGRKILLITSSIGMVLGTLMLGVHFYITRPALCSNHTHSAINESLQDSIDTDAPCNTHYFPLAITSVVIYNVAFQFGWGPVPWILMAELLPQKVRGVASGIATLVNWGTAGIVVGFYLDYANLARPWFAWWSFALINLFGIVFVWVFIPETKRRTLEEIQDGFGRGWSWGSKGREGRRRRRRKISMDNASNMSENTDNDCK